MRILWLLLCCVPFVSAQVNNHISLVVDRNCPVICDPAKDGVRGYAVDIVNAVFREANIAVDVLLVPYARMGQMVQAGQADASIHLATSVKSLDNIRSSKA